MIIAKLKDGFAVELDDNAMDYTLLEDVVSMEKDGTLLFSVVNRFLGEENKGRLLQHLADPNGRVPLEAVATAIRELMDSFQSGKNSASSPD